MNSLAISPPSWYKSKKWAVVIGWAGTAGNSLGQLIIPPLLLAILGQEALALWQLVSSCFFLTLLADLGTSQGVVRTIAESVDSPDIGKIYDSARLATWIVSIFYCLFFFIILFFNLYIDKISVESKSTFIISLSLFGVWGFFRTRFQLRTQYHLAVGNVGVNALIQAMCSLSRPCFACLAVYLSDNFLSLPITYILCEIVSFSLAYFFDEKPQRDKFSKNKVERIFSFGLGNGVSSLAGQAANYIQPIFITMTLGVTYIPIYICTLTSAILLQRFMFPIVGVWYPSLISWNIDSESIGFLPPRFKKVLLYGTFLSILAGIITGLLNHIFVKLWVGEEMFAGALFSWLVALQVPLFFLGNVAGTILRAYAVTPRPIIIIAIIELSLTCILSIPAFSYFGLPGGLLILTFIRMTGIYLSSKSAFENYKVKYL